MNKKTPAPDPNVLTQKFSKDSSSAGTTDETAGPVSRRSVRLDYSAALNEEKMAEEISGFFSMSGSEAGGSDSSAETLNDTPEPLKPFVDRPLSAARKESRRLEAVFADAKPALPHDPGLPAPPHQPSEVNQPGAARWSGVASARTPAGSAPGAPARKSLAPLPPAPESRAPATPEGEHVAANVREPKEIRLSKTAAESPAAKGVSRAPITLASAVAPPPAPPVPNTPVPNSVPASPVQVAASKEPGRDVPGVDSTLDSLAAPQPDPVAVSAPPAQESPESDPGLLPPPSASSGVALPPASSSVLMPPAPNSSPDDADKLLLPRDAALPVRVETGDSLGPAAVSLAPAEPRRAALGVAAAVAAAVAIAATFAFFMMSGPDAGKLVVSVAGPGGTPVSGVRVYVDDQVACEGSPCVLEKVKHGSRLVAVEATGFSRTAAVAVRVDSAEDAVHNVQLTARLPGAAEPPKVVAVASDRIPRGAATATKRDSADSAKRDAPPEETTAAEGTPAVTNQTKRAATKASSGAGSKARQGPKFKSSAAKRSVGARGPLAGKYGKLNLRSVPQATVLVDGRPVGTTPKLSVRVRAGSHIVVFVDKHKRRKQITTFVKPDSDRNLKVRF